jgi:hypothetical protein
MLFPAILVHIRHLAQEWFMLQKGGPSPSGRWGHAMVSNGTRVFVVGGGLAVDAQADETAVIHVLETSTYSFCHFIWTTSKLSLKTEDIENPKPDPNAVKRSEKTTQLNSSAGPSTQRQPQYPTSSSSDTFAAHITSPFQNPTPTSVNGKTKHVPEKNDNRVMELERQLSATLAAKMERDQRLVLLTEELALRSAILEQAEANAVEATKRAGQEPREPADRLLAQTSLVEHKDTELVRMQAKLDELVVSRDQHVRALEQAQSALQTAESHAAVANERSQRACEQIQRYKTELAEVHAELKAGRSELEAVRLRLTDAEIGLAKSKAEADTLRALTTAGLVGADEDRLTRGLLERIRAMEVEMASQRWSEKSLEALETRNEG